MLINVQKNFPHFVKEKDLLTTYTITNTLKNTSTVIKSITQFIRIDIFLFLFRRPFIIIT